MLANSNERIFLVNYVLLLLILQLSGKNVRKSAWFMVQT